MYASKNLFFDVEWTFELYSFLDPCIRTNGAGLRGAVNPSNIQLIQFFQFRVLGITVNTPYYQDLNPKSSDLNGLQ